MNITEQIKRKYSSPKLNCTLLDNSISLELQSDEPPVGPGEPGYVEPGAYNLVAPEYFNKNNPLNA